MVMVEERTGAPIVLPEVYPDEVRLMITEEDIVRGRRGKADYCAAALAARRRWDGANVTVAYGVSVYGTYGFVRYTSPDLLPFVNDFDRYGAARTRTLADRLKGRPGRLVVAPREIVLTKHATFGRP